MTMIVIDKGVATAAMAQDAVKTYLQTTYGIAGSRLTNLSQALNQAFDGNGKSCGANRYAGNACLHASAGVPGVSSVSLFYYLGGGGVLNLVAMGAHESSTTYRLSDFGAADGDFKYKKVLSL